METGRLPNYSAPVLNGAGENVFARDFTGLFVGSWNLNRLSQDAKYVQLIV